MNPRRHKPRSNCWVQALERGLVTAHDQIVARRAGRYQMLHEWGTLRVEMVADGWNLSRPWELGFIIRRGTFVDCARYFVAETRRWHGNDRRSA